MVAKRPRPMILILLDVDYMMHHGDTNRRIVADQTDLGLISQRSGKSCWTVDSFDPCIHPYSKTALRLRVSAREGLVKYVVVKLRR